MPTLIYALLIFGLLIFVHEFGHFIVAKIVGVRVEEFSLGMGPKAFSFEKGETVYTLRLLPVGGYVKMAGETGMDAESKEEEDFISKDPGNFNNKTVLQRFAVISAGAIMNFILAICLFAYIFSSVGVPQYDSSIGEVLENTPAELAGILPGDKVLAVEGKEVKDWTGVIMSIRGTSGQEIEFTIERDGITKNIIVIPEYVEEMKSEMVGIVASEPVIEKYGVLTSLKLGVEKNIEVISVTTSEMFKMITGKVNTDGVAGPVGIVKVIGKYAEVGITPIIALTAYISVSLGFINLLPIPALDGSRLVFLLIEALRGRPVDPQKENLVHLFGFALLMMLMIFVTYKDIFNFYI